jgi:hypothetical protein
MGVEYWIVDTNQKVFYDLGKGGWYDLEPEALQDQEYLALTILDDIFTRTTHTDQEWQEFTDYINNRVVPELFKAFGQTKPEHIQIVNDCGDDHVIMKVKKYRCIGTRYGEPNSPKYSEYMQYNNKHLIDNPLNKRLYNPDNYTKYPEWNKY